MHRMFHLPSVSEGIIDHISDGYINTLELATGVNYTEAARNSASLQYFALEAYAYDIAVPGEGCVGKPVEDEPVSSAATASATTAIAAPVKTDAPAQGKECHTHDDGTEHCV